MDADQFVRKWTGVTLKERSSSQEHFIDLCRLLDEPTQVEADPTGEWFCFEKGAEKTTGADGWADVWRKDCFAWEYKGPGKDLKAAFAQLQQYTPALDYPPLLIVSDAQTIEIHTAFNRLVPVTHVLQLEDLRDHAKRRLLKWAFSDPNKLKPTQTTASLTEEAAGRFAELALALRSRGHPADAVAHFSQQLLFCMFAEDIDLLPDQLFSRLLKAGKQSPAQLGGMLSGLFGAMAKGGLMGVDVIDWFNGGLFNSDATLPLEHKDVDLLIDVARLDWSAINPIIFGTLFERGLDPDKRTQLGAHYTDPNSIMRLVDPVVLQPLREEWSRVKVDIQAQMNKADKAKDASARTRAAVVPDKNLTVITRADDTIFGVLHSRFHELWSLRMGTSLEDRPRYTPTTTFETFPFPEGITPSDTTGETETLSSGAIIPSVDQAVRTYAEPIAEAAHQLMVFAETGSIRPNGSKSCPRSCRVTPIASSPSPSTKRK